MHLPLLPFLSSLVALYEAGSVTAAAVRLHRTQPAVSYQLRQLEAAFGAALFLRRGGKLIPTPACERLVALTRAFSRDIETLRVPQAAGSIAVASVSSFGRHVVFPALQRLRPVPQMRIVFPDADEVARQVLAGEVEVGFSFRPSQHAGLDLEPVYSERLDLIASRAGARHLKSMQDLDDVPWITWSDGDFVFGRWFGHHLGRRGLPMRRAAHCQEIEEVVELIAGGLGVSILPSFVVSGDRRVQVVDWGRKPLTNTVFALRRAGDIERPLVAALLADIHSIAERSKPARR